MHTGKYIFSQIVEFVDKYEFDKCVKRYQGNRGVRELSCWSQFLHLLFGQLTSQNSIRMICVCLKAHDRKHYHLGIKQLVHSTTLTRANESRDWRIFADFGNYLINKVQPLYANHSIADLDLENEIYVLDATSISVSINLFHWAEGKYSRGAIKMHTLLNLRGLIPEFIWITDGKCHDSNALDLINFYANAIYLMDKAYVDFEALYRINNAGAFFVSRAKQTHQQYFNKLLLPPPIHIPKEMEKSLKKTSPFLFLNRRKLLGGNLPQGTPKNKILCVIQNPKNTNHQGANLQCIHNPAPILTYIVLQINHMWDPNTHHHKCRLDIHKNLSNAEDHSCRFLLHFSFLYYLGLPIAR